jgi:hypothetical protein
MKKSKKIFSCLVLIAVMAFTIMPSSSVYADGTGPQGGSNSGSHPPQPPPPPPPSSNSGSVFTFIICWIFGPPQ